MSKRIFSALSRSTSRCRSASASSVKPSPFGFGKFVKPSPFRDAAFDLLFDLQFGLVLPRFLVLLDSNASSQKKDHNQAAERQSPPTLRPLTALEETLSQCQNLSPGCCNALPIPPLGLLHRATATTFEGSGRATILPCLCAHPGLHRVAPRSGVLRLRFQPLGQPAPLPNEAFGLMSMILSGPISLAGSGVRKLRSVLRNASTMARTATSSRPHNSTKSRKLPAAAAHRPDWFRRPEPEISWPRLAGLLPFPTLLRLL